MISRNALLTSLTAGLFLTMVVGCGPSRPETSPVTGKVTFQGKPVPEGTIVFYPEKGRSASGRLQPDGTYTLTTFDDGDGAILGSHTVTIEAVRFPESTHPKSFEEEISMGQKPRQANAAPVWLIPRKYAAQTTSGLTAKVTSGGNAINFDLKN